MMFMFDSGMPEHLDAITTISRDMFYCILASKLPSQKKVKTSLRSEPTPRQRVFRSRSQTCAEEKNSGVGNLK